MSDADRSDQAGSAPPEDVRPLGANTPITVTARDGWLVESGTVDLFAQSDDEGRPGRRHLLASVERGGLVWPGPGWAVDAGWNMVAIGEPGTTVRRVPSAALEDEAGRSVAARGVEDLARAIAGDDRAEPRDQPGLDDAAAAFASAFSRAIGELVAGEGDEARRIAARPAATTRRLDRALTELTSIMDGGTGRTGTADQHAQIGLVLRRIGAEIGLEVPDVPPAGGGRSTLVEWARAGGARVRVASLSPGWWRRPGTPMVGYVDDGTRPVALLPRRRGWHMFDPKDQQEVVVDDATTDELGATVHVVYPTLHDGPVSAGALVRFALRGARGDVWRLLGMGLLAGVLALVTPVVVSVVYDVVLPGSRLRGLAFATAFLGLTALTVALATLGRNLVLLRLEGIAEVRVDPAVIDRLLRTDTAGLRTAPQLAAASPGDLASRISGLQRIRESLTGSIASAILTLAFSLVSLVFVFVYSVTLALVAAATLVVTIAALGVLTRVVLRHTTRAYDAGGRLSGLLLQGIQGISKVRVAGAESRFTERWARGYRVEQGAQYAGGRAANWITAITGALASIVAVPVYIVAATTLRSSLSTGEFLGVLTALGQFAGAVAVVSVSLSQVLLTAPLWGRLSPVLEVASEPRGEAVATPMRGQVELVDVSFGYRSGVPPVMRGVSLRAEPGEFIAITGPSGGGKSTLMRLILGLERPDVGAVLIDGRDTRQVDMAQVRRTVGMVPQDGQPLPGSVMDTILGAHGGTEQDAWAAARAAGIADEIVAMPMRMHTIVGEGGAAFSGGQVQRLLIARALARRPPVVLLDEATSALDDRTQADLSARLDGLSMTRIVIAHRLSTIRHADRIYVIDQGSVVESGTFEELMRADGMFARLATRQIA